MLDGLTSSRQNASVMLTCIAKKIRLNKKTGEYWMMEGRDEFVLLKRLCYESLERVIGINHKYWNHGKIKGDKSVITPFDIRNGVILTLGG